MKTIEVPILNNEYKVIVCFGSPSQVEKVLQDYHHDSVHTKSSMIGNRGTCFYTKDAHPLIALPSFPKTPEQIGTLSHEAVHAIENIFMKISQPVEGELFAHSVGAVVRIVLQKGKV